MNLKKENALLGIFFLVFAGFYYYLIINLPARRFPDMLGPEFMPKIFATILAALSLMLIAEGVFKHRRGESASSSLPLKGPDIIRIAGLFLLIILYIYGIIYIGYLIATPVFLAVLMYYGGSRKISEIAITSIVVTGVVYYLFSAVFKVSIDGIAFL